MQANQMNDRLENTLVRIPTPFLSAKHAKDGSKKFLGAKHATNSSGSTSLVKKPSSLLPLLRNPNVVCVHFVVDVTSSQ